MLLFKIFSGISILATSIFSQAAETRFTTEPKQIAQYQIITKAGKPSPPSIQKDRNTLLLEKLVTPWVLFYTNQYRKENEVDTLKYDDCLGKAAGYQSEYLFNQSIENNQYKLGHQQEPDSKWFKGKTPSERALSAGCQKYCGENAMYFTIPAIPEAQFENPAALNATAKKIAIIMVYEHWHRSKGHRDNMITKGYTSLGVSVAIGKSSIAQLQYVGDAASAPPANLVIFGIQVLAY